MRTLKYRIGRFFVLIPVLAFSFFGLSLTTVIPTLQFFPTTLAEVLVIYFFLLKANVLGLIELLA